MAANKETVQTLVKAAVDHEASDLHLSTGRKPILRVAGRLLTLSDYSQLSADDLKNILSELLTESELSRFHQQRSLDFSFSYKDIARFRCNSFYAQGVPVIAMRLIASDIPTLEDLNLPQKLEYFADLEQGFFLVVGPVGMGKSTTLASLINIINERHSRHIITIEDPLEYLYTQKKSIIDQREVRIDTPDFRTALRSVFRQDVDVVLLGEMRGRETIETAVTAAETGHLVFSTLHTNSAAQTVNRIIDSFPSEQQRQVQSQLAASLSGILSQRLVPRISGGVIPAYELLVNNKAIANLIRDGRTHEIDNVIQTSGDEGMSTLDQSLAQLVHNNEIEVNDARRFSRSPRELEQLL
ncbi:MAG: PilT/PilU family type 4a pilus ATPase [Candidatus Paceibacterota bacterium]